jgi:hypothetical protein
MGNQLMKDRQDVVAPSPNVASSRLSPIRFAPIRLAWTHFWKVLAAVGLCGSLWVLHAAVAGRFWNGARESTHLETRGEDDDLTPRSPQHFRLMRELIDKQSQPATIVFKNQAPSALGYLASVDNECVVLRSLYKDEAKEQTILIPWDNILYIRLNTKVPAAEPTVTASRDPRVRSVERIHR